MAIRSFSAYACLSFSDSRPQLAHAICIPHNHPIPDQDTAITRPKEARKGHL